MKSYLYLLLLSILVTSCAGPSMLSYRASLEKGSVMNYRLSQSSDTEVWVMGQNEKSSQNLVMGIRYKAEGMDDNDNKQMSVRIEDVMVLQKNPQLSIEFDSKKAEGDDMFDKIFRPMVGHEMRFTLDSTGKFMNFAGSATLLDQIFDNVNSPELEMMRPAMEGQFGDDSMEKNFNALTAYLPNASVKVGDSWVIEDSTTLQTELLSKAVCKLVKRAKGIAYVEVDATVSSIETATPMDMGMMKISYDLRGTKKGMVEIDESTGFTINSNLDLILKGKMFVDSDLIGQMEMDLSVKSKDVFEKID